MHKADKALLQKYEQDERSCFFTDDTVMSLAIAAALQRWRRNGGDVGESAIRLMREFGQRYPDESYGVSFTGWLHSENPQPYNSWGNGAAMRVSACAWVGQKLDEVKTLSVLSRR
jgi:type I restriction enzyme M protein